MLGALTVVTKVVEKVVMSVEMWAVKRVSILVAKMDEWRVERKVVKKAAMKVVMKVLWLRSFGQTISWFMFPPKGQYKGSPGLPGSVGSLHTLPGYPPGDARDGVPMNSERDRERLDPKAGIAALPDLADIVIR
jgi:hypothetical protein